MNKKENIKASLVNIENVIGKKISDNKAKFFKSYEENGESDKMTLILFELIETQEALLSLSQNTFMVLEDSEKLQKLTSQVINRLENK